ncbi:hypothetical protein CPAR01_00477 [Colletotrichum paranaense]|uniref:Uncharacterized protein n=1 Tax=Colletotrichum paranaense TaxID=1914294 RepID=A0ABQ9T402_9PEZI|nr:uncharacterized protein CPAR01_00477 [Colletotrichum paranaense]KAK1546510.1 hypothetical protein CPAR01_00477 [Colletotrichum paranaense]
MVIAHLQSHLLTAVVVRPSTPIIEAMCSAFLDVRGNILRDKVRVAASRRFSWNAGDVLFWCRQILPCSFSWVMFSHAMWCLPLRSTFGVTEPMCLREVNQEVKI